MKTFQIMLLTLIITLLWGISEGKSQNINDNATITVLLDSAQWTTRTVLPHTVNNSYANVHLQINLNDTDINTQDGAWSLVDYSDNLANSMPDISGNITGTLLPLLPELAEQEFWLTYRANDTLNAKSGIVGRVTDEVDRYRVEATINYTHNGNPMTIEFSLPNSAAKHIFSWDPEQPIPFYPFYSYASGTQPAEFEDAMINLGDILTNPELNLMKGKMQNRNTTSPYSEYWDYLDELMTNLSVDPLVQDTLYPISISVVMVDFTKDGGKSLPFGGRDPPKDDNYKSSSTWGDVSFENPMPDATIPTNLDTNNVNGVIGWGHEYDITVSDTTEKPKIVITGNTVNLDYSVEIEQDSDNPHKYKAHLLFGTGNDNSVENLVMDFEAVPVGTQEPQLPSAKPNAYPNPFTNSMSVQYNLNDASDMKIEVYDMQGKLVKTLHDGMLGPGQYTSTWDGTNASGAEATKGIYFIKMISGEDIVIEKIMRF